MKILFFCRTGCNYSSIALSYIQKYFDDVTVVENRERDSEISNDIRIGKVMSSSVQEFVYN